MWERRSHNFLPLTKITSSKVYFKWTKIEQDKFDEIKLIVACDTLFTYTDFNEEFKIHTDDRYFQLGAVISQKVKPIAFNGRKLTDYEIRYTVTERELLSIIETIKEFRTILLGQRLRIYNDHKKLTCKNFNTDIVLRQRLIIEEYGPEVIKI